MEKASELLEPRYIAAVQSYLSLCAFSVCPCMLANIERKNKETAGNFTSKLNDNVRNTFKSNII